MELMKALDEMNLSAADWRETPVAVQYLVKVSDHAKLITYSVPKPSSTFVR